MVHCVDLPSFYDILVRVDYRFIIFARECIAEMKSEFCEVKIKRL